MAQHSGAGSSAGEGACEAAQQTQVQREACGLEHLALVSNLLVLRRPEQACSAKHQSHQSARWRALSAAGELLRRAAAAAENPTFECWQEMLQVSSAALKARRVAGSRAGFDARVLPLASEPGGGARSLAGAAWASLALAPISAARGAQPREP